MINQEIIQQLKKAITTTYPAVEGPDPELTYPESEIHGDYTSNIALILAKSVGQPPRQVAETLAQAFSVQSPVAKVEVAGPGFLNFYLADGYWPLRLNQILEAGANFATLPANGQTVLFEYGTPNTHKVPHIGHLFSYCYGESCTRLLEKTGIKVIRDNYQGDVGLHVAKCLWAYQRDQQPDPETLAEQVAYLQQCYQTGSQAYEDDQNAKAEIDELNRIIYRRDPSIVDDWQKTREWSLAYYRQFEERIGSRYDQYYLESQTSLVGLETVKANLGKVFLEDEGAIIFRGEAHGLHTRVFVNRFGNPTYEAKDIGLAVLKQQDWQFDRCVITTANEQSGYWQVVKKAIELVLPEYQGKIIHLAHGMINLTTGKMSSRTGKIMTAFALVETVKDQIRHYIQEHRDYSADTIETIAEAVAIGAIKYSFLKSAATKNISFDIESSIVFEGSSGPYLMYTFARTQSLLAKATAEETSELELSQAHSSLVRWLHRYPDVVAEAASAYAPHVLATYLFELAQRYSTFYNDHPILTAPPAARTTGLALTKAVGIVLADGLELLGIKAIDMI